jgi:hypothetical protein
MLKKALEEASQLPEAVQDKIADLVMTELRSPHSNEDRMQELVRRGLTDKIVRNRPEAYRRLEPLLSRTTAKELLDQERGDR